MDRKDNRLELDVLIYRISERVGRYVGLAAAYAHLDKLEEPAKANAQAEAACPKTRRNLIIVCSCKETLRTRARLRITGWIDSERLDSQFENDIEQSSEITLQ